MSRYLTKFVYQRPRPLMLKKQVETLFQQIFVRGKHVLTEKQAEKYGL
jgi:hypothetical protein